MKGSSSKKQQALDDLEGSWFIHITKDAKVRKFTVRKACSGDRAKNVAGQPFAKEIRYMTHGANQPF